MLTFDIKQLPSHTLSPTVDHYSGEHFNLKVFLLVVCWVGEGGEGEACKLVHQLCFISFVYLQFSVSLDSEGFHQTERRTKENTIIN